MPLAMNISHDNVSPRTAAPPVGRNWPDFSARYNRIALLSKTVASPSTITGTFAFGLSLRNAGACCSPLRVSTGIGSYGRPASSRNSATLTGFGAWLK